jgi:NACalpha-BTF3-like transcription factor
VNPKDVKFIVDELEVTSEAAEQALKESGGDVVKALQRLLP